MSSPSLDSVIRDPARVAAVRALGVLNSAVHRPLDDLTHQAASAVLAPMASVTLLDDERQFFVAVHGAPSTGAGLRQCPVDRSICQFTVAGGEPLRIPDLREDSRFGTSIDLGGLQVVAYLGVPLRLRDGTVAGSLCVVDGRPRDWSQADVTVLTELAGAVAGFLALRNQVLDRMLHDPVTGVPGETLFVARCDATRERHAQGRSAMFRIEFAPRDATGGASREDADARRAATLLTETVGATDVVGRLDDGAFAVLAHELRDERDALRLAGRIRCALREATRAGDAPSESAEPSRPADQDTTRIGIALRDVPGASAAELLRRAEHVIRGAASRGVVTEIARRVA